MAKLLDNPQQVAIVALALGALAFVLLFAIGTWGVKAWRAFKGHNGHVVMSDGSAAAEAIRRAATIPPGGVRLEDLRFPAAEESEVSARDLGILEGEVRALTRGHRDLREDLNTLTATVAAQPGQTVELMVKTLVDQGIIEDRRKIPRPEPT